MCISIILIENLIRQSRVNDADDGDWWLVMMTEVCVRARFVWSNELKFKKKFKDKKRNKIINIGYDSYWFLKLFGYYNIDTFRNWNK